MKRYVQKLKQRWLVSGEGQGLGLVEAKEP